MKNQLLTTLLLASSVALLPVAAQTYITGSPQATIRGGAAADLDIVEAGGSGDASGTVSVKFSTSLLTARKHYARFDLTGHNPNTNGPLYLRYDTAANSQRQLVQVWSLDQSYPGMATNITWNTAQANDTNSGSALLTAGPATATPYGTFLSSANANVLNATHSLHGPWGHMIRSGDTVYLALTSLQDIGANGLRFQLNSVKLGFDNLTTGAPPSLSALPDITVASGQTSVTNAFTVGDPEDGPNSLTPVASSSNTGVVDPANIYFEGTGANRTLHLIGGPVTSNAVVVVTITDADGNVATRSFNVTNIAFNSAPLILAGGLTNAFPPTNTLLNTTVAVPFAVSDAESPNGSLSVSATVAGYSFGILQDVTVNGTPDNTNLSLTITPQTGADGVGVVYVSVSDTNGNTTTAGVSVMVRSSPKVVFIDRFDYDAGRITTNAPNFWTRRQTAAQSVLLTSYVEPLNSTKVLRIRPNAGAEAGAAPLVGGPYNPSSRAILYTKFKATFTDPTAGGIIVTNGDAPFFRLSQGAAAATTYVQTLIARTNGVPDGNTEFKLFLSNGGDGETPTTNSFPQPGGISVTPVNVVLRYDVQNALSTMWIDATSETNGFIAATDAQAPVPVGYVGVHQVRGNSEIWLDDLQVVVHYRPLITGITTSGGNVEVDFNAGADDVPADFVVERQPTIFGGFSEVSASISSLGGGNFRATLPAAGDQGYLRIKRKPVDF